MNFDFDETLKGLIDLVEANIQKAKDGTEHHFEWLLSFPEKARQRLNSAPEEFKMPKTPARKKTRQQKKRVLGEDDGTINGNPVKKEKLSTEETELRESLGAGRPRRQASNAAKSKIQHNLKMLNGKMKLRRPGNDEQVGGSVPDETDTRQVQSMECSPVLPKTRAKPNVTITLNADESNPTEGRTKETKNQTNLRVNFAPESENLVQHIDNDETDLGCSALPVEHDAPNKDDCEKQAAAPPAEAALSTSPRVTRNLKRDSTSSVQSVKLPEEAQKEEPKSPVAKAEPPKKATRTTRKTKKTETVTEETTQLVGEKIQSIEQEVESLVEKQQEPDEKQVEQPLKEAIKEPEIRPEPEVVPKKKALRKPRKAAEEKPAVSAPVAAASPRMTRNQRRDSNQSAAANSPRVERTPIKKNVPEHLPKGNQFQSPRSSPVKKVFTPKLVFSPFKPTSVKTKVEAFEAVLSPRMQQPVQGSNKESLKPVLPEARVLLRRLTDQELKEAGVEEPNERNPVQSVADKAVNDGTFVLEASEDEITSPVKPVEKERKQKVTQILARKSVDKAKQVALAAARSKLMQSTLPENPESPNVHLNKNASSIMSKFRFASGSSGSSSASLNRHVAMTSGRTPSNIVTGVGTFIGTKPIASSVTKATEDEENKRKEQELRRLKEKEEEAARKREELLKAKAEEQKKKHEARVRRAMEQRAMRAKQLDQETKQKLETKEEKTATLKLKLQAEHQEKAEKARQALLQRQQEAEQRRKAEELQKQREWEEEQQRILAVKKEQEELERQAKIKLAEAEKARLEAERARAEAERIKAEAEKAKAAVAAAALKEETKVDVKAATSSKLNTTVTLSSYQITPVRVTKAGKIYNPDNYDISDMRSDDSTDDDSRPKKTIPDWARSHNIRVALAAQAKAKIDTDEIFPPALLRRDPDLNAIFKIKRARFNKRTSSAVWKTPPAHYM